ncbi:cytochrome P450, putative [Bodo saltans]|uniref:Cytochrome P450, putative n=1 Tax=Bodo saltans TaxID=75058 RepID=A0A0S4ILM5_BODSA|nr:cytochrome P450, putative [Bodo saltans]|eukprot:CUE71622.1 cytochrome P450, putative [Bodo saltans]
MSAEFLCVVAVSLVVAVATWAAIHKILRRGQPQLVLLMPRKSILSQIVSPSSYSLDDFCKQANAFQFKAFWYFNARMARWCAHVSHPDDVSTILLSCDKGDAYADVSLFLGSHGLLTLPLANAEYCYQRRKMQRAFAPNLVRGMATTFGKHASALRNRWLAKTNNGSIVTTVLYYDISESLVAALCEISGFSIPSSPSIRDVASAFRRAAAAGHRRSVSVFGISLSRSGGNNSKSLEDATQVIQSFAEKIVALSLPSLDTGCLLSRICDEDSPDSLSPARTQEKRNQVLDHVKTFLFAGFETTMNSLLWSILLLSNDTGLQTDLAAEINSAFPPSLTTLDVSHVDLIRSLPLLRGVVKEALRLFPPAPIIFRTVGGSSGLHLPHSNVHIPSKTVVAVDLFSMQRNPTAFPNPTSFCPQRWQHECNISGDMDKHMAPFSSGARACLGRDAAMTELMVFIATLVQSIKFDPLRPHLGGDNDCIEYMKTHHVTLAPEFEGQPLRLKISQRIVTP